MSDAAEQPRVRGLFIPASVLLTIGLALAGTAMAYVFATKPDLAKAETRVTVVEQKVETQAKAIDKIERSVDAMEQNVRTLLIEQGVEKSKIIIPEKKE